MKIKGQQSEAEGGETRVVLRRYLAGVPYSHRREMAPVERRMIWAQILPYVCAGSGLFLSGLVLLILGALNESTFLGWMAFLGLGISAGFCAQWAWPFIQALRARVLDVYIGPLYRLDGFDAAHDLYLQNDEVSNYLQRYVELLAVGNGERIWQLEGVGNDEKMASVRSVLVATVPDVQENGRRPLTREEKEELLLRARELRRIAPFAAGGFFLLSTLAFLAAITASLPQPYTAGILCALGLVSAVLGVRPLVARYRFGTTILRDRKRGEVIDGTLPSGLPWVVKGEPARWRVAQPKGGAYHRVTIAEAKALEDSN
jgi:hypothetical protein